MGSSARTPLACCWTSRSPTPSPNGTPELRAAVAATLPGATEGHVLVANGGAEANFVACWRLIEPGDEVVVMQPNYGQVQGLAEGFGAIVRPWPLREERAAPAIPLGARCRRAACARP